MIEAEGLSRSFPGHRGPAVLALESVSLHVGAGGITGVLGPNGSGKTTLFRILACLLRPGAGAARIMGCDVVSRSLQARERLGFLTEEPGLPGRLTPLWHVSFHASLHGLPRREALDRSRRLLEEMGLISMLTRPNGSLSRGNRLKVALARALVHEPGVLLLDEPSASLDIESAAWLREQVKTLAERGGAVLMATHNPREAEDLCDKIVVLRRGAVAASGTPAEIRRRAGGHQVVEVTLSGPARRLLVPARRIPELAAAVAEGNRLLVPAPSDVDRKRLLAALLAAAGELSILELRDVEPSLEDVYRRIQGQTDQGGAGGHG